MSNNAPVDLIQDLRKHASVDSIETHDIGTVPYRNPPARRAPPFFKGARGDLLTAGYEVDDRFMADLVPSPRCCLSGCFTRAFMADSMT